MRNIWIVAAFLQVVWIRLASSAAVQKGQVYPMGFMNITSDRTEEGFAQCYGYSINDTQIRVSALPGSINSFATVGTIVKNEFNLSVDFDQVNFVDDYNSKQNVQCNDKLGIIAASNEVAYFIGVKSDRGSTDAFLAFPLMRQSTEFYVAGWPYNPPFYASCMIIPALNGTCVEIYKTTRNRTQKLLGECSLSQYQTFRYAVSLQLDDNGQGIPDTREDMTGYYINSTKPIQVVCGHECANVPVGVPFCDHMAEQIPPVNQLGTFHVVPPINGRSPNAGYVVRVVATQMSTQISVLGTSVWQDAGTYYEFKSTSSMAATVVICDKPCLVMQYNTGRKIVSGDVPTDPFMTLVVPSDRFTAGAGFATPNYCDVAKVKINFDNWISIVTFAAYASNILFDRQPVLQVAGMNTWDTTSIPGYAIISFRISHDFHYVSNAPGTTGSFAAYVYGHSILTTSSSAYGFSANYNITGDPVSDVWVQSQDAFNQYLNSVKNSSCTNETTLVNPILNDPLHVSFPFTLTASFNPVSMDDSCIEAFYRPYLWTQLNQFTHLINQWICSTANCSYLRGYGVAINYNTLSIAFLKNSKGNYNGVSITVEMMSSLDISSSDFSYCRMQIKNFMSQFVNWPNGNPNLFPTKATYGCPWPLNFDQAAFVVTTQSCSAT